MTLTADAYDLPGHTVLAVGGDIDVHTSPTLQGRISDTLESGRHALVVDLSAVEFLDSSGLGVLVAGLNRAREVGGDLTLVCARANVLKLFEITGLDQVFAVYPTVAEAVADVSSV
jgi:anti-sigma B factor antagonist